MDASRGLHKTRVNGWQLKPYFSQVLEDQEVVAQESLDSNKPLGLIAQDPSLAQPWTILPLVERMSAQAGYKEQTTSPKDESTRHECLLHLGEG